MNKTLIAKNLAGVRWITADGQRVGFWEAQSRVFGVANAAGQLLTFDGEAPYTVKTARTAKEVADTIIRDGLQWLDVKGE